MMRRILRIIALSSLMGSPPGWALSALVLESDFGTKDGAVASMKGVAFSVSPDIPIFDLTHEIPPFDIWQASFRLNQAAPYWPVGTVFVCVVDPGLGTDRPSVALRTGTGHLFVTPDNGTLTFVAESLGIDEVREIDTEANRLQDSEASHTFHGRDLYALVGARLAAGLLDFEKVGPKREDRVRLLDYQRPLCDGKAILGTIPVLDPQFGNVWTNIDQKTFAQLNVKLGQEITLTIFEGERIAFTGTMPYARTFGDVSEGEPLAYLNSMLELSFAINMGDFAKEHGVSAGQTWRVKVEAK